MFDHPPAGPDVAGVGPQGHNQRDPDSWWRWWAGLLALIVLPLGALAAYGQTLPWADPVQQGCNRRGEEGKLWLGMAYGQRVGDTDSSPSVAPTPAPSPSPSPSVDGGSRLEGLVVKDKNENRVGLTPIEGSGSLVVPFGLSRGGVPRRVEFETARPIRRIDRLGGLYAGDILGDPGGRIPDENIRYRLEMVQGLMTIRFCVSPLGVSPGEYTGTVHLRDGRFETRDIPLTVTLQYNGWHLVLAALWLTFIAGAMFKWLGAQRAIEVKLTWRWAARDLFVWAGARFLTLAAATVALAGVVTSQYLANPSWSSTPKSWFALLAAGFAATVTAVSAGEVAKPTREKGLEDKLGPA